MKKQGGTGLLRRIPPGRMSTMDFTFHMPVQVFSGEGCVKREGARLRGLGRRCLIITGARAAQESGALEDMLNTLEAAGVDATVFPGISANPLLSQCQAAAFTAETCKSDFIVGIGGGSVMDAAKAAAWLAGNSSTRGYELMAGQLRRPALPLVLVGTTAGTGSEVSAAAVLTLDREKRKKSITNPQCYARYVFADPRYTHSSSRETTVSTALDAFSHAAEGWLSPGCGDVSTAFGERALTLVSGGLHWLAENDGLPDAGLRESLYYGSLWAGMVLNACGTAFPHPLGYILTEEYGVPHGMACAVFLPALLRRAEKYAPDRTERLFTLCGGRDRLSAALDALVRYDITMTEGQIAGYAERWEGLKNFTRTPGGFTPENAAALFRSLFIK